MQCFQTVGFCKVYDENVSSAEHCVGKKEEKEMKGEMKTEGVQYYSKKWDILFSTEKEDRRRA